MDIICCCCRSCRCCRCVVVAFVTAVVDVVAVVAVVAVVVPVAVALAIDHWFCIRSAFVGTIKRAVPTIKTSAAYGQFGSDFFQKQTLEAMVAVSHNV